MRKEMDVSVHIELTVTSHELSAGTRSVVLGMEQVYISDTIVLPQGLIMRECMAS